MITAAATLAWLLIVLLPGTAVLRLLGVPASFMGSVAIAAPLSLGLIYLVGLAATRFGLPMLASCLVVLAVVLVAWLAVEAVRLRRDRRWSTWWRRTVADEAPDQATARTSVIGRSLFPAGSRAVICSRALLVLALAVGIAVWTTLHAQLLVPAGWDSMHHGYFVRQILAHDTMNAKVVLSSDPSRADGTTNFYPLAANLLTALLFKLTGISIPVLILAGVAALAGVILPLGVYFLCIRLAPRVPPAAGFAALASVLPAGLFTIEYTGRVTAIIGVALVPAAVGAIALMRDKLDGRLVIVSALTLVGVVGTHTSELPVVVALAVVVVLVGAWQSRRWRAGALWLVDFAAAATIGVLLVIAAEPGFVHLIGERTAFFGSSSDHPLPFGSALRQFLLLPSPFPPQTTQPMKIWSVMAAVGCVLTVHSRWRRLAGAAIGYVGYGAFYIAWLTASLGPLAVLADAWYRNSNRMQWELFALGAIPVGVALSAAAWLIHDAIRLVLSLFRRAHASTEASVATALTRANGAAVAGHTTLATRRRLRPGLQWASAVIAGTAVLVCTLIFASPPAQTVSTWLRANVSPVSSDSIASFRYLADHVRGNQRVLDDLENHGDLWMYIDYGVPTLFGNPPLIGLAPDSWKQRLYLRGELSHIATNGCVADLLAKYHVAYVYYSGERMSGDRPRVRLTTLQDPRYFQEVFTRGATSVFKVEPLATPRPCDTDLTTTTFPWSTTANST